MYAPFEMTEGKANLQKILDAFPANSAHWSEAENRFNFIDRLLTECLGWQRPNITVEEKDDLGGRADYILGIHPKAVLEAKKEAIVFELPPTGRKLMVRKLQPLLVASKPFKAAVQQVIPYCAIRGAPIAAVCNGPQLAIFQAFAPGASPLEGECYLFNGHQSYIDEFPLLWSLLSPEGVTENRAYRELAIHCNPRIPQKASSTISAPNQYRYRTDFQENMRNLSAILLDTIEDEPALKRDFYRDCYVSTDTNNRHLLMSKNIIAARYRRVSDDGVTPAGLETAVKFNPKGTVTLNEDAVGGARPIVVIGDVGVGKTSFFENLFQQITEESREDAYFLHINLGIKATMSADIKTHILNAIPDTLNEMYNVDIFDNDFVVSIYHQKLREFDRSIYGSLKESDPAAYQTARIKFLAERIAERDRHLHAALGHLSRGRKKQIILVIDNADQRTFAVQQEAFLIAQELAATRNLLVFVALRPSTFYHSKSTGALSGYQNRILTIAPPPAEQVVEKRLSFALRLAEGKGSLGDLAGISFKLGNVVTFLRTTLRSIKTNDRIKQFLGNITGGNTREVIEMITGFVGSPNVNSEKIVQIEERTGQYIVPLHEFAKHALLGDYAYFNENSSLVACNVFDVSSHDNREHFLSSLVIALLQSNVGARDNDGYIAGERIIAEMTKSGFVEDQSRAVLRRLALKRLLETPHGHYRELLLRL